MSAVFFQTKKEGAFLQRPGRPAGRLVSQRRGGVAAAAAAAFTYRMLMQNCEALGRSGGGRKIEEGRKESPPHRVANLINKNNFAFRGVDVKQIFLGNVGNKKHMILNALWQAIGRG